MLHKWMGTWEPAREPHFHLGRAVQLCREGWAHCPFRVDSGLNVPGGWRAKWAGGTAGRMGRMRGGPNRLDARAEWAGSAVGQMGQVRGRPNGQAAQRAEWAGCTAGRMGLVCGGPNGPGAHSIPSWHLPLPLSRSMSFP